VKQQCTLQIQHPDPLVNQISLPDAQAGVTYDIEGRSLLYTNIDQFLNERDDLELAIAGNESNQGQIQGDLWGLAPPPSFG